MNVLEALDIVLGNCEPLVPHDYEALAIIQQFRDEMAEFEGIEGDETGDTQDPTFKGESSP